MAKAKATRKTAQAQEGLVDRTLEYLRSTRAELRKVVWPTRDEAINLTVLVLVVTIAMTAILGGIDYIFGIALNFVLQIAQ